MTSGRSPTRARTGQTCPRQLHATSVDPLLMIGLARQESHFDRMARSPVGAVGLFQVMPYTAAELDPAFTNPAAMDRLVSPRSAPSWPRNCSQAFGALSAARWPRPIASYNADKERVQMWWDAAKGIAGRALHRQHSVSADARLRQAGAHELRDVSTLRTISIATKIIAIATAIRGVNRSLSSSDPRMTAITGFT